MTGVTKEEAAAMVSESSALAVTWATQLQLPDWMRSPPPDSRFHPLRGDTVADAEFIEARKVRKRSASRSRGISMIQALK